MNMNDPVDIVARTIWGEARSESEDGIKAVANVIANRVKKGGWWGNTFVKVCLKPYQFSCWNTNDPNRRKLEATNECADSNFRRCLVVARDCVNGVLKDITYGSTHYHTVTTTASWVDDETPVTKIGRHMFYNNIK
tara:strand:- start:2236 stop:2643 length:408 start_codon:yes stop_codon:yes gene_type:complete